MSPRQIPKYVRTMRYLRPVQIISRIRDKFYDPSPSLSPAPPQRKLTGKWTVPPGKAQVMLDPVTFHYLNESHRVETPEDWDFKSDQRVTRYNLHYFDDLVGKNAHKRRAWQEAIIERWITENAVGSSPGWEAYPTSLRIVNWIKWRLAGNALSPAALHSLAVQSRHLATHVEWQLLANHLLTNAKTLVMTGLFFGGSEGEEWLNEGMRILSAQFPEQVLADGAHYERSPMYQCIIVEDVLDLINMARAYPDAITEHWKPQVKLWEDSIQKMRFWLKAMSHPDGGVSFFNDSAMGVAPNSAELDEYASALGLPPTPNIAEGITHLKSSGFVRLQRGTAVVLIDVAPVGPDYQPGHAHADTLSFEMSIGTQRFLVNSGTSTYAINPQRDWERSTEAHNCVVVDGESSSEVWKSFRVARRAKPFGLKIDDGGPNGQWSVTCSHDGYKRLPGKPVHTRKWQIDAKTLKITDSVNPQPKSATAFYHLHPEVACNIIEPRAQSLSLTVLQNAVQFSVNTPGMQLVDGFFHPEFKISLPNKSVQVPIATGELVTEITWD